MNRTLVLFPGLGADERLFEPLKADFPDLLVPGWPEPRRGESLPSFAARVAESVPRSESLVVGGSSFGGMVALEVAPLVRANAVILIGSARRPDGLVRFPGAAAALARLLPEAVFRPRRSMMPLMLSRFGTLTAKQHELFWNMATAKSSWFIKWGLSAILTWTPSTVSVPIRQIHGSADRVIPVRLVQADRIVEGGGHLLSLTHPADVSAFIAEALDQRGT